MGIGEPERRWNYWGSTTSARVHFSAHASRHSRRRCNGWGSTTHHSRHTLLFVRFEYQVGDGVRTVGRAEHTARKLLLDIESKVRSSRKQRSCQWTMACVTRHPATQKFSRGLSHCTCGSCHILSASRMTANERSRGAIAQWPEFRHAKPSLFDYLSCAAAMHAHQPSAKHILSNESTTV